MKATHKHVFAGALGIGALICLIAAMMSGCSSDEDKTPSNPTPGQVINITYEKPLEIEVDSDRHWALLLHDRNSPSGTTLQLVDLGTHRVISSRRFDYYDVYDVAFVSPSLGCFAGRPQGNIGYAVQFFDIPDLTLTTRVIVTSDTTGEHGYLAVDTVGNNVYYSHAGGGSKDGIYKISVATKGLLDADNNPAEPHGFDNGLVAGSFKHPSRIFYDYGTQKIIVANLDSSYVTVLPNLIWGSLIRSNPHSFPVSGMSALNMSGMSVTNPRAEAMASGAGIYVFVGTSGSTPYLSRFVSPFSSLDFLESKQHLQWDFRNADIRVHPREDITSVFVLQHDSVGTAIGQYRLNNLMQANASPYRPHYIAQDKISAIGIDIGSDQIVVGDASVPRLELISIQ